MLCLLLLLGIVTSKVSSITDNGKFTEYKVDSRGPISPIKFINKRETHEVVAIYSKDENKANKSNMTTVPPSVSKVENDINEGDIPRIMNKSASSNFTQDLGIPLQVENSTEITGYTFTNISQDVHHKYYKSFYYKSPHATKSYWVDFNSLESPVVLYPLSQTYRQATTVSLSFKFPFYGHMINNVTLTTGGFLYTGQVTHSWLAATQYIAPLMGNFHTNAYNTSTVKYYDNGTAFIVLWDNVALKDDPANQQFTFQVTLLNSGDIIFGYKKIPIPISDINESSHPVKVGISDAYFIDRIIFYTRRKTLYEYHKVELKEHPITNDSFIYFEALPTCLGFVDCLSCTSAAIQFECKWCEAAGRCSDGLDRHKQSWMSLKCNTESFSDDSLCAKKTESVTPTIAPVFTLIGSTTHPSDVSHLSGDFPSTKHAANDASIAIIMSMLVILGCVAAIILWVIYAYRNPQTPSGQFLIRYRPTQWRFKRGETRYTPAVAKA